jgi:hypothetical protein
MRRLLFVTLAAILSNPLFANPPVPEEWSRMVASRSASAKPIELALVIPRGSEPELLLLNRFAEELDLVLKRRYEGSPAELLEVIVLKPRQPWRGKLPVSPENSSSTSSVVTLHYSGDTNMLQAWVVFGDPSNRFEVAFAPIETQSSAATRLAVFRPVDGLQPRSFEMDVALFNSGESLAIVEATVRDASGASVGNATLRVPGRATLRVPISSSSGTAVYFDSDAPNGSLVVNGYLLDTSGPWQALTLVDRNTNSASEFSSFSLPPDSLSWLTVHNSGDNLAEVEIQGLPTQEVDTEGLLIPPHATRTVPLPEAIHRFRASTPSPGVSVTAHQWQNSALVDLAVVADKNVHDSGTYALGNLLENGAALEVLNLGTQPSEILVYAEWHKGAYSFAPAKLPPGESFELNLGSIARDPANAEPDSLGRLFEPADRPVFLQWFSRPSGARLLGRLTLQNDGEDDSFGFNCFGCCEELPTGVVLPGSVVFDIGQTVGLETAEFIDSCTGRAGPFPISAQTRSYAAPLNWNGVTVSSSGVTRQTVGFTATGTYTWVSCSLRERTVRGSGEAEVDQCQKTWNPNFDPQRGCPGMFAVCSQCTACCGRELSVALCRCQKLPGATNREICERGARLASQQSCTNVCIANDPEGC